MTPRLCAGPCARVLLPFAFIGPLQLGTARYGSRSRCGHCYKIERCNGTIERVTLRRADVVDETAFLADQGLYGDQISAKLGLSWDGIRLAHRRAGAPVPVHKNPAAPKYYRKDVSRGTPSVRSRVAT